MGVGSVALALAVGVGAFALGRVVGGGHPPTTEVGVALLGNTLAAVAEEAFFRRFLYRLLEPHGTGVAVLGTAALFAAVHVTVYGLWVLPIDLAAGLILSWQRWSTGSWVVPAITHVLANVLVVM
jgi:membrane protease YdiL (CAAX protease family)